MKNNSIQFAVVREDPEIEGQIAQEASVQNALLIGSGGCTAFHLKAAKPNLIITVIDPNAAQLKLIAHKQDLLLKKEFDLDIFDDLNACGNFESLFTQWRLFIYEFVASKEDLHQVIFNKADATEVFKNPYWEIAFKLFFSDPMLLTMFGPNAIQHAVQGSYPLYFQTVFERGLLREDRSSNYFLHHILFGDYDRQFLPYYLTQKEHGKIDHLHQMSAEDIKDFGDYDLISLSNIFDWMRVDDSAIILNRLSQTMKSGAYFILRQLNNNRIYDLGKTFTLQQVDINTDRSLFYNKITIYRKD